MPHDVTYGLGILDGVSIWQRAYSDLRSIYALYESFRRFQTQQTAKNRIPSPQRAWLDLTEGILNDPKYSINSSLTRLDRIVDEGELFTEAVKVILRVCLVYWSRWTDEFSGFLSSLNFI